MLLFATVAIFGQSNASNGSATAMHGRFDDFSPVDTLAEQLQPKKKESPFSQIGNHDSSAFFLKKPSNIRTEVDYDPLSGEYLITEKAGEIEYRLPGSLSLPEFLQKDLKETINRYWRKKISLQSRIKSFMPVFLT